MQKLQTIPGNRHPICCRTPTHTPPTLLLQSRGPNHLASDQANTAMVAFADRVVDRLAAVSGGGYTACSRSSSADASKPLTRVRNNPSPFCHPMSDGRSMEAKEEWVGNGGKLDPEPRSFRRCLGLERVKSGKFTGLWSGESVRAPL